MARQYIVPGKGYVDADGTIEYVVPGGGYVNVNEGSSGPTYTLTAASGSFTLTGVAVGLKVSRVMAAGSGSFSLTGQNVNLVYSPISGPTYTLTANVGTFTLTGIATGLRVARKLPVTTGTFTLTGNAVGLAATRKLSAEPGSFTLTGYSVGLRAARKLPVSVGVFTLTGNAVGLSIGGGAYQANKNLHIDSVGGMVLQIGTTRIPFWNTSRRPSSPKDGTIGFNSETSAIEVYDGSTWRTVALT